MNQRIAPDQAPAGNRETRPLDLATMRETARQVMAMGEPGPELEDLTAAMRGFVQLLVPEIRTRIAAKPAGDQPARVAQVGVDEAWRRLHTTPGFGPDAAYRRAQKLALSVFSLCDHYENLQPPAAAAS